MLCVLKGMHRTGGALKGCIGRTSAAVFAAGAVFCGVFGRVLHGDKIGYVVTVFWVKFERFRVEMWDNFELKGAL